MSATDTPTTSDFDPGLRAAVRVPGTTIDLPGTVVDPSGREVPSDHVLIRFDGQAMAYEPTPIGAVLGTWSAA